MEKNCSLIQEIEQELARLTVALDQTETEPDTMVIKLASGKIQWTNYHLIIFLLYVVHLMIDFSAFLQSFFSYPEHQDIQTADKYGNKS